MSKKKIIRVKEPPPGLFYIPGFLRADEEEEFLKHIDAEAFKPVFHQGFLAKRVSIFYGAQGGYKGKEDDDGGPIPAWIEPLRDRCAQLIGLNSDELEMALVANYPVGAGIGWHRDAPQFGPTVLGVSFASDGQLRFRRFVDDKEELFRINLERGSAYIMSGPARSVWQHGLAPVTELRYSITFRTVNSSSTKKSPQSVHEPDNIAEHLARLNVEHGLKLRPEAEHKQLSLF